MFDINESRILATDFSVDTHILNAMKIRPVGFESFHFDRRTDGRTDRNDEADSRFSQFCERA